MRAFLLGIRCFFSSHFTRSLFLSQSLSLSFALSPCCSQSSVSSAHPLFYHRNCITTFSLVWSFNSLSARINWKKKSKQWNCVSLNLIWKIMDASECLRLCENCHLYKIQERIHFRLHRICSLIFATSAPNVYGDCEFIVFHAWDLIPDPKTLSSSFLMKVHCQQTPQRFFFLVT